MSSAYRMIEGPLDFCARIFRSWDTDRADNEGRHLAGDADTHRSPAVGDIDFSHGTPWRSQAKPVHALVALLHQEFDSFFGAQTVVDNSVDRKRHR